MNQLEEFSVNASHLLQRVKAHRSLVMCTVFGCSLLALVAALCASRPWEASQAVVVRQEAAASANRPGKFADLYEMRTLQETILELAKSRSVLAATIQKVASTEEGTSASPPSDTEVDELRDGVTMLPPNGAEFGKTEVFYLYVKDNHQERAIQLVGELCRQLDLRLQSLRNEQAAGLVEELQEQLDLASELHSEQTQRLAEYEAEVGADLGELRMLHSAFSGQSDLRQQFVGLEEESRKHQAQLRDSEALLALLRSAQQDPGKIVATPNRLLASQPALRRLKDGLLDAQLNSARLQGTRSAAHPIVAAAIEAEAKIRTDLFDELTSAIETAQADLTLNQARYERARKQCGVVEKRLGLLAKSRAEYSNRVAAVETSRESLDVLRRQLNTAKASHSAVHSASILTPLDSPDTAGGRQGMGLITMVAGGMFGGLFLGIGLVVLGGGPLGQSSAKLAEPQQAVETPPASEWWEQAAQQAATSHARPSATIVAEPIVAEIPKPVPAIDSQAATARLSEIEEQVAEARRKLLEAEEESLRKRIQALNEAVLHEQEAPQPNEPAPNAMAALLGDLKQKPHYEQMAALLAAAIASDESAHAESVQSNAPRDSSFVASVPEQTVSRDTPSGSTNPMAPAGWQAHPSMPTTPPVVETPQHVTSQDATLRNSSPTVESSTGELGTTVMLNPSVQTVAASGGVPTTASDYAGLTLQQAMVAAARAGQ